MVMVETSPRSGLARYFLRPWASPAARDARNGHGVRLLLVTIHQTSLPPAGFLYFSVSEMQDTVIDVLPPHVVIDLAFLLSLRYLVLQSTPAIIHLLAPANPGQLEPLLSIVRMASLGQSQDTQIKPGSYWAPAPEAASRTAIAVLRDSKQKSRSTL